MKKYLCIIMVLLCLFTLCGCGSSSKYDEANTALENGDYNSAIVAFTELADKGFSDSAEKLKEAKYEYIKNNLDRDDSRCVGYLEELKNEEYKDTESLYNELYSWKVKIAINTTKQSSIHKDKINVTGQLFPFYHFNFRTYDGPPDGEYRGRYEVVFSNGSKISDTYIGRDNDFYFAITLSGTENPRGDTTFNVYGENDVLLATATSYIY